MADAGFLIVETEQAAPEHAPRPRKVTQNPRVLWLLGLMAVYFAVRAVPRDWLASVAWCQLCQLLLRCSRASSGR